MNSDFASAAVGFPEPFRLLVRDTVSSTNDELRILAEGGAAEGLVLLADEQTAGRGRRGAAWFSAPTESLAFSILLRPQEPKVLWPRLSLAAGLSVAESMDSFGAAAGIKWPNDIWISRRKLAGILVEAGTDFAIVGIGINVNSTAFPDCVSEIATSLRLETGIEHARAEVLAAILNSFARRSRQIGGEFGDLLNSIRQRCVLTGHQVSFCTSTGPRQGKVEGIAPGGELLLRTENGLESLIQADEVRIMD